MLKLKAHAKLNLFLDITGTENNFHTVDFVNTNLELHDIITIREQEQQNGITITSDSELVPIDNSNLCYGAAKLLINRHSIKKGVHIHIEKKIPFIGGLGGGSADAAATMKGINKLFRLGLSKDKLISLIKDITTDGCYCINGGVCRVGGVGEKIYPLSKIPPHHIIIIEPETTVPNNKTAWMYKNYDNVVSPVQGNIENMLKAIKEKRDIENHIFNSFEQVKISEYKKSHELIRFLRNNTFTFFKCYIG